MELSKRNLLESRLKFLRQSIMALGKFGKSEEYYLDHLDKIMKEARYIASKLALDQERLDV